MGVPDGAFSKPHPRVSCNLGALAPGADCDRAANGAGGVGPGSGFSAVQAFRGLSGRSFGLEAHRDSGPHHERPTPERATNGARPVGYETRPVPPASPQNSATLPADNWSTRSSRPAESFTQTCQPEFNWSA
jgi:hypothetical protein